MKKAGQVAKAGLATCIGIMGLSLAYGATNAPAARHKMTRMEIMNRKGYRANGGVLIKPGSKAGSVAFVNQQRLVGAEEVQKAADSLANLSRLDIRVVSADPSADLEAAMRIGGGTLTVVLAEDANAPALLVAPEDRWAKVNVRAVAVGKEGKEAKGDFLASRVRKEMARAFAYLCGAASGQADNNILSVSKAWQLDGVGEGMPIDAMSRILKYLDGVGVRPMKFSTYKRACEEGWAPAPTNDIQKAIWDKVRAVPKNPMKIEFDPKKGR